MHSPRNESCPATPLLLLENVSYTHPNHHSSLPTLQDINLRIVKGETCALLGESGSGKSTLLNILGLLDCPTSGSYRLDGIDCVNSTKNQLASIRNHKLGFIFQSFNLLPRMNALENIALPLLYRGVDKANALEQAKTLIRKVGLEHRALHRPDEMSGGQKQRIAIARALIGSPSLILADEPTGNLDTDSAQDIVRLLTELNTKERVTLVVVTHDIALAQKFQRRLSINNGRLTEVKTS